MIKKVGVGLPWLILICIGLIIVVIVLIVILKTLQFKPQKKVYNHNYTENDDILGAGKLSEAIRIQTISHIEKDKMDWQTFHQFHEMLQEQFPLVHKNCVKTAINEYSLVYCLKAKVPAPKKMPILITAHMDVVPVEEGTESRWTEPPFCGCIKDGIIWGRGTLDTKAHLIAAMEAMERLLEKDFKFSRDIYFAFGHDEEINGEEGAKHIAQYFVDARLKFDFVLDEGGCAARKLFAGIDKPVALVGVGEKGFANIRLSVTKDGGHASMPEANTSLGILAKALCRLEKHPLKPHLIPSTRAFLLKIGPHMKGFNHLILANLWLFKPLFLSVFSKMKSGNAMLRTTLAVTMAQGSPAPNVVPQKSTAVINCRILPGEDGDMLLNHIRKTLKGLPVELEPIHLDDPSMISPSDCEAFHFIEGLIEEFCGEAIVVPYLVMASTDARKYEPVCKNIYRFTPYVIDIEDLKKVHGTNENISVVNVNRCIDFFMALMERL